MHRKKNIKISSFFKKFAAALLSLVFFILIAEIAFTIYFNVKDNQYHPISVADYPYTYFIQDDHQHSGYHSLKTTYTFEKPENTYRIVLTGGSVARAGKSGVTIADYLEHILSKEIPNKKVEVINAGISAYNLQQEFIFFHTTGVRFQPDMVISLSGYNDLLAWMYNRFEENKELIYPHQWRDLKVVENVAQRKSLSSRLKGTFPSLNRAINFFIRNQLEKKYPINETQQSELEIFAEQYAKVITDFNAYCMGMQKDNYMLFFQPVRFSSTDYQTSSSNLAQLNKLYQVMIEKAKILDLPVYDFSDLLESNHNLFLDDCHVNSEGNQIIANAIARKILQQQF